MTKPEWQQEITHPYHFDIKIIIVEKSKSPKMYHVRTAGAGWNIDARTQLQNFESHKRDTSLDDRSLEAWIN